MEDCNSLRNLEVAPDLADRLFSESAEAICARGKLNIPAECSHKFVVAQQTILIRPGTLISRGCRKHGYQSQPAEAAGTRLKSADFRTLQQKLGQAAAKSPLKMQKMTSSLNGFFYP